MKYNPADVLPGDLDIAAAPYLGGEFSVYLAEKPAVRLGTIEMSNSGNGSTGLAAVASWTPRPGASINGAAADLVLVAESRLISSVNCEVTFNVTDDLGVNTTMKATFKAPVRSTNQSSNFPRGIATDMTVASGADRKVAAITGLAGIVGGHRGVKFAVYQLPEFADYTLVGETTSKKFGTRSRKPVGIDSGLETDKFVKLGKSKPGSLAIDSKGGSIFDGLTRFDGALTTGLLIGQKEEGVTQNNFVFVKFIPSVDMDLPDGEGEAMFNAADGKYQDLLLFEAA